VSKSPELPATTMSGAVPTLNGRGFMLEALDGYASEFIALAKDAPGEVLDIGCAYGVASLAALAAGARVCACDMEQRHLDVLLARTPPEQRDRLRTVKGVLPGVGFASQSFQAILASRVIHFLTGDEIRVTLLQMFEWLAPGGRIVLVVDTPYMPGWNAIVPAYEASKAAGEDWPGFIPDFSIYRTVRGDGAPGPAYLNTLDPDILARECERAGFTVERTGFFGLQRLGAAASGKEHAGCVARKPAARRP